MARGAWLVAAGVLLLSGLVLLLLAGVLLPAGVGGPGLYRSGFFLVTAAVAALVMLLAMVRLRRDLTLGHGVLHAGLLVILAGACADRVLGTRGELVVPLVQGHVVRQAGLAGGARADLGFGVSATQLDVDYYPPEYDVLPAAPASAAGEREAVERLRASDDGSLRLGDGTTLAGADLRDADGFWKAEVSLASGRSLRMAPPAVRNYRATLAFSDEDGSRREAEVAVNRPVAHRGWLFSLSSTDDAGHRYVVLAARRAPGRPWVVAGMWMVMVATARVCLGPDRRSRAIP